MIGCISAEVLRENEIAVVHVHVTAGNLRPYSMIPDRPEGVYVRTESASVPASLADIARIVRDTPITPFEAQPSAVQTLSFNAMNAFCAQAGVIIPPEKRAAVRTLERDSRLLDQSSPTLLRSELNRAHPYGVR